MSCTSKPQHKSYSPPIADPEVTLGDLFGFLWYRRVRLCAAMVFSCALAVYYLGSFTQNTYQAMSTVRLDPQNINVVDVEKFHEQFAVDAYLLNTELRVMQSPRILNDVIDRLDLQNDLAFRASATTAFSMGSLRQLILGNDESKSPAKNSRRQLIEALRSMLDIALVRETYIIEIRVETISPSLSFKIANAMADSYIKHQRDDKIIFTAEAATWLNEELEILSSDLLTIDRKIAMRRAVLESTSESELQRNADQIRQMRMRLADLRAQRDALQPKGNAYLGDDLASSDIETILSTAETVLGPLESPTDKHGRDATLNLSQRLARLEFLDVQIASLENTLHELTDRISNHAAELNQLKELEREQSNTEALHEKFSNRLRETELQSGLLQPDARLLDYAKRPNQPSGPRWLRTIFFVTTAGTILTSLAIIIWNLIEPVVRSSRDWNRLNTHPIFAVIPKLNQTKWEKNWFSPSKSLITSSFYLSELRAKLIRRFGQQHGIIMVTGCGLQSDHTALVTHLAENFAALPDKRVLVIDFDTQNQSLAHHLTGSENCPTVQELLATQEHQYNEILARVSETSRNNEGFDYIPAGNTCNLPLVSYTDAELQKLFAHCRTQYDWIIISLPVAEQGEAVSLIAEQGDYTLYAVKSGISQRFVVSSLSNLMASSKAVICPILMNTPGLNRPKTPRPFANQIRKVRT